MDKVYLVEIDRVVDGEKMDYPTEVFESKTSALEYFKSTVEHIREYCKRDGWTINDDEENYFRASGNNDSLLNRTTAVVHSVFVS